jgi:sulfur-oxidizing protein SoxZ
MAEDVKPRIKIGSGAKKGDAVEVKKGELIEVKTLIQHVMETGQRKDSAGKTIPRKIVNKFTASFNGKEVFAAKIEPGVSVNPLIAFFFRPVENGAFDFAWTDDDGTVYKAQEKIVVG